MTDDPLKRLEDAMAAPPSPRRKSAAAEAAMRAFDEEFSETTQGSTDAPRPTSQTTKLRSWIMTTLSPTRLRPALMGGASFAALSLGLFVVFQANDAAPPATLEVAATGAAQSKQAPPAPATDLSIAQTQPQVSQPLLMA